MTAQTPRIGTAPVLPADAAASGQRVLSRELVQQARHPGIAEVAGWEHGKPVLAALSGAPLADATLTTAELADVISRLADTADALHRRGVAIGEVRADDVVRGADGPIIVGLGGLEALGIRRPHHDVHALVRLARSIHPTDDATALERVLAEHALAQPPRVAMNSRLFTPRPARRLRRALQPLVRTPASTAPAANTVSTFMSTVTATPPSTATATPPSTVARHNTTPSPAVLVVAIVALLAGSGFWWFSHRSSVGRTTAGRTNIPTEANQRACAVPLADPDGDGKAEPALVNGSTIVVGRARFAVPFGAESTGRPGASRPDTDVTVVVGDWDGDGLATPGVIRADGRWRFDHWPTAGGQEPAVPDPLIDHGCTGVRGRAPTAPRSSGPDTTEAP